MLDPPDDQPEWVDLGRSPAVSRRPRVGLPATIARIVKTIPFDRAIHAPRYAVPGVVVLGLFYDPAGNRVGLVEMKNGKPMTSCEHQSKAR